MNFKEFLQKYKHKDFETYPNHVSTAPMVSVCITTYQHVGFIAKCLDSILMQKTTFPFEILLGEDSSLDGTRDTCIQYAEKHPDKIKLFLHENENKIQVNGNHTGLFNYLHNFYSAKGKYIALCDGDDYWTDPYKLQKQVDFLESNTDYVITYGSVKKLKEEEITEVIMGAEKDLSSLELMKSSGINTLTACYRNVLKEFPLEMFNSGIGDLFIWSLLGSYGKGKYIKEITPSIYRVHGGGIFSEQNNKMKLEMWRSTSNALFLYYKRINNQEVSRYFQEVTLLTSIKSYGVKEFLSLLMSKVFKNINPFK